MDKTAIASPAAASTSSTPSDSVKAVAPKAIAATKPVVAETVMAKPAAEKTAVAKPVPAETILAKPVVAKPAVIEAAAPVAAAAVTVASPAVSAKAAAAPVERLPKAVQEMAETGIGQARDAFARIKTAAETLASSLETSSTVTSKGVHEYSVAVIEALQSNLEAGFGLMRSLAGARTVSEAIELQTSHARRQFEAVNAQAKALASIANRTATEAATPVRDALGRLR
jgi:phasin